MSWCRNITSQAINVVVWYPKKGNMSSITCKSLNFLRFSFPQLLMSHHEVKLRLTKALRRYFPLVDTVAWLCLLSTNPKCSLFEGPKAKCKKKLSGTSSLCFSIVVLVSSIGSVLVYIPV